MPTRHWAANNLAARLLAGPWTQEAIAIVIDAVLGPVDLRARADLITDVAALAEATYPPTPQALTTYLVRSRSFKPHPERPIPAVLAPPRFAPTPPFAGLPIPALATQGDLAAWLGQSPEQLDWLADERRRHSRVTRPPLRHYHYTFASKRTGAPRLIEAPKPRLKAIQRRILREILSPVPTHPRIHGFVAGRSCLTGAQIHAGEAIVATFDLTQFFPSIGLPRIHGLFRSLGYPWAVARRLTGLCTTTTPSGVFPDPQHPDHALYRVPHLPQGAPTSPALANLLAWTLDRRLDGLARSAEANYTRYADDLAFSGDEAFVARIDRFRRTVETILEEEGFALNTAKTRIMPRSTRQRVTGIVVNEHCNIGRAEFDTLKAILHNCTRTGPAAQNREAIPDFRTHLDGRIAWVEQVNFPRGLKLRRLFDQIDWTPPP
ncbi:reverse transcriptase family protein [Acidisphaera sp. S103]|uniref:reverse transcriptase family protein n=1 Tax=Acidisphaera sp. S103 TaxID=1747223 RepID=UPI00131E25DF|nr:reverse transcriptase family protein [Acidisphaera sp. S103]